MSQLSQRVQNSLDDVNTLYDVTPAVISAHKRGRMTNMKA